MSPNVRYPILIGGLLAIPVTFVTLAIVLLSGDPSFAVEPDYYGKAVNWDTEMAQQRANGTLGWSVRWTATPLLAAGSEPGTDGQGAAVRLHAVIEDRSGVPVRGLTVQVVAFHNADSGRRIVQAMSELTTRADSPDAADGYVAIVPMTRPGLWELRLTATRGAEIFTDRQRLELKEFP